MPPLCRLNVCDCFAVKIDIFVIFSINVDLIILIERSSNIHQHWDGGSGGGGGLNGDVARNCAQQADEVI